MKIRPNRRELLAALGAGAAAGCGPERVYDPARSTDPTSDWAGLGEPDLALFPLAVQSGDPRPDGLMLWTRYEGAAALEVVVVEWTDGAWKDLATVPAVPVDGYVHVVLDDLAADRPISFQFRDADGALSPVGLSRTAMAAGTLGVVRFGATSCCSFNNDPFPNMSHAVARGPMDFFLWTGDAVYADGSVTLAEYRAEWYRAQQTSGFQDVMTAAPMLMTWDDHEVNNNWNTDGATAEQIQNGRQAMFEHNPIRRDDSAPERIWRKYRFGLTCEVFVLDCRGERDLDAMKYISDEQMQWLKDGLAASPCTWKVLVNSVPIANFPAAYDVLDLDLDRWEGFPASRQQLLDHIDQSGITGVLFVSGDLHHCSIGRLETSGPASRMFDVLVGPAGSVLNAAGVYLMDADPNQWIWSDADWNTVRFELYGDGVARIDYVRDTGETLCSAVIDTVGNVLSLDFMVLDHS
jgi:alkaline phosphatase D